MMSGRESYCFNTSTFIVCFDFRSLYYKRPLVTLLKIVLKVYWGHSVLLPKFSYPYGTDTLKDGTYQ